VFAILGVIKPCTCLQLYPHTAFFVNPQLQKSLTHSVNLIFGSKSGFKKKYRDRAGFGFVIWDSGRDRA